MDVQLYDEIMSFKRTDQLNPEDHHPPTGLWPNWFHYPTTSRRESSSWGPPVQAWAALPIPQELSHTARFKDKIFFLKSKLQ